MQCNICIQIQVKILTNASDNPHKLYNVATFLFEYYSLCLQIPSMEMLGYATFKLTYSTAHVQVYKKTLVKIRASRNFAFNSRVGLVRHEKNAARER